jgi:hypothetical protein
MSAVKSASIRAGDLGFRPRSHLLNKLIATGYFGNDKPVFSATNVSKLVLPLLVMAAIAIIGGIFALNKKFWGIALAGAICAIFSPDTWILGVVSTVIVRIAKHEFQPVLKPSRSMQVVNSRKTQDPFALPKCSDAVDRSTRSCLPAQIDSTLVVP